MQKLKVETIIHSDIKKVWKHWNAPESIMGWAFASSDWQCPYAENDLKTGGKFLTRMSAKDGSASFDFTGTYTEVIEFQKITYQMDKLDDLDSTEENRMCEVVFTDLGDGTVKITEEFDSENMNSLELQTAGWQAILENFKTFTENN